MLAHVARGKISDPANLKILSHNHMLKRLPIVVTQVKASNTSENLLNEIKQIVYSLKIKEQNN